ncbi:MAG: hypothetical protein AAF604_20160 [Acidobacteriota bacterium]
MRFSNWLGAPLLALALLASAASAEIVDENSPSWAFFEEIPAGLGSFGPGPDTPPMGNGSAAFAIDGTGRLILGTNRFAGTRLDQLTTLTYWTYRSSGSSSVAISLQLNVDYDLTDGDGSWQGRLVFEPSNTPTAILDNTWQEWDSLAGSWWSSGAPGNGTCPISSPCTTAEVLSAFPDAGIQAGPILGVLLLKAGGPWAPAFFGAADGLTVGVDGTDTVFDFEEDAVRIFVDGFESGTTLAWSDTVL